MDYRLTDEDKERIKLLNEVSKNRFKNFSLEQLIRLQELLEKKDYTNQKKAAKSKKKLLSQINVEIYKRDDVHTYYSMLKILYIGMHGMRNHLARQKKKTNQSF